MTMSCGCSCRNSSAAACSQRNMPARPSATISACRYRAPLPLRLARSWMTKIGFLKELHFSSTCSIHSGAMRRPSAMSCACLKKRGRCSRPPAVGRDYGSGLAAGEAHGRGAGAVIGLDVDKADHALFDLLPGAQQGQADVLGLFDIFGVAAERLGHLVVARVAETAAGVVALRVGGPAAIEADHAQERQFVPDRGVELHRVLPERAVAVQADALCLWLGGL